MGEDYYYCQSLYPSIQVFTVSKLNINPAYITASLITRHGFSKLILIRNFVLWNVNVSSTWMCYTILVWTLLKFSIHTRIGQGGERGVLFPSHPSGESVSLKPGSSLLCDLLRASFWRPWRKEAPATRHQTLPHQTKSSGGKAQLCCCRDCQPLHGVGWEQWQADSQPATWGLVSKRRYPALPTISHQDVATRKPWAIPGGTFLSCSIDSML